jgi:hypothetical protein
LKYLVNKKAKWNTHVISIAGIRGDLEMLIYSLQNKCPTNIKNFSYVKNSTNGFHLECWYYCLKNKCFGLTEFLHLLTFRVKRRVLNI